MIADMVKCAIAGLGLIHAAGRLFVCERFSPGMSTVIMTQNVTRRRDRGQEPNISAMTEAR